MYEQNGIARKGLLLVLPVIMLLMMACSFGTVSFNRDNLVGSGKKASEDRQVSDVERVSLRGSGNLNISQGDSESLTVEADDNILPHIKTEMRGRELILQIEEGYSVSPRTPITYTLKVKDLTRVSVSGSGNVTADSLKTSDFSALIAGSGNMTFGKLDAGEVSMDVSGSGKMKVETLTTKSVDAKISGSGDYNLTGEADKQTITITGAGNYIGGDLKGKDVSVRISGSGDVTTWAMNTLNVTVTGSGKINYYGSPEISQTVSGGGKINSLGEH